MLVLKFILFIISCLFVYLRIGKAICHFKQWVLETLSNRSKGVKFITFPVAYIDNDFYRLKQSIKDDIKVYTFLWTVLWPVGIAFHLIAIIFISCVWLLFQFYSVCTKDFEFSIKFFSRFFRKKDKLFSLLEKQNKLQTKLKELDSEIESVRGSIGAPPYR